jgi:hypothetical protein
MSLHLTAQPAQVQNSVDPAQKMIARNHIFEIEFIKKAVLPTHRLTHHRPDPLAQPSLTRNHDRPSRSKDFFNTLSHKQKWTGGEYFALDSAILGLYSRRVWS